MSKFCEIARNCDGESDALRQLHDAGASPIQAIRALHLGRGLSLAGSKALLMESIWWKEEAESAAQLHSQWIELIESDPEWNKSQ